MRNNGFTLIELLVVTAIILILASIVIPVIQDSTGRSSAVANPLNASEQGASNGSFYGEVISIGQEVKNGTTVYFGTIVNGDRSIDFDTHMEFVFNKLKSSKGKYSVVIYYSQDSHYDNPKVTRVTRRN